MIEGQRAKRRRTHNAGAGENLTGVLQRQSPSADAREFLEREERKDREQLRLIQRKLFFFELFWLSCSFIFGGIVIVGDYPLPLQLGTAATLCYIFRELIKHMTRSP
jgi:hypothetical protein